MVRRTRPVRVSSRLRLGLTARYESVPSALWYHCMRPVLATKAWPARSSTASVTEPGPTLTVRRRAPVRASSTLTRPWPVGAPFQLSALALTTRARPARLSTATAKAKGPTGAGAASLLPAPARGGPAPRVLHTTTPTATTHVSTRIGIIFAFTCAASPTRMLGAIGVPPSQRPLTSSPVQYDVQWQPLNTKNHAIKPRKYPRNYGPM